MKSRLKFPGLLSAVLLVAYAFAQPTIASAQDISDSHLAAARDAVAASRSTQPMDGILPGLADSVKKQLIDNRPDAADQIIAIVDEAAIALAGRRGDLENEIARIYARTFTEEELQAITEFYRSEVGAKLIEQTPVIARSMDQAARVWTTGVRRDLNQAVREKIVEAGLN